MVAGCAPAKVDLVGRSAIDIGLIVRKAQPLMLDVTMIEADRQDRGQPRGCDCAPGPGKERPI